MGCTNKYIRSVSLSILNNLAISRFTNVTSLTYIGISICTIFVLNVTTICIGSITNFFLIFTRVNETNISRYTGIRIYIVSTIVLDEVTISTFNIDTVMSKVNILFLISGFIVIESTHVIRVEDKGIVLQLRTSAIELNCIFEKRRIALNYNRATGRYGSTNRVSSLFKLRCSVLLEVSYIHSDCIRSLNNSGYECTRGIRYFQTNLGSSLFNEGSKGEIRRGIDIIAISFNVVVNKTTECSKSLISGIGSIRIDIVSTYKNIGTVLIINLISYFIRIFIRYLNISMPTSFDFLFVGFVICTVKYILTVLIRNECVARVKVNIVCLISSNIVTLNLSIGIESKSITLNSRNYIRECKVIRILITIFKLVRSDVFSLKNCIFTGCHCSDCIGSHLDFGS